jgi:5-methylthioadenosine/S-adenosylhomocysteine deaminase
MKAMLTWCVFGIGDDKEIGPGTDAQIACTLEHRDTANGRIHTCLGPHSPYVCPPEFLARIVELAGEHALPVHLHVSESWPQVENSRMRHGKTPVEHLRDLGIFEHPTIAAHCLALAETDLAILAEKAVTIPRTPITYMKLAMPVRTPVTALQAAGITRIALGSDGPASNATMDMWDILRQQVWLEKYSQEDPEALPGDAALRMATQNGAAAMGFAQSGVLAVGRPADMILVDFDGPHVRPRHDLIANLVHSTQGADVTHAIVDGRLLMRNRELLTLDEERILHEAERHAFRMVGQDMRQVREYRA